LIGYNYNHKKNRKRYPDDVEGKREVPFIIFFRKEFYKNKIAQRKIMVYEYRPVTKSLETTYCNQGGKLGHVLGAPTGQK
jgi:hypothetical protein